MAHPQLALRNMLIDVEYPPGSGNLVRTAGMPWRAVAASRGAAAAGTRRAHRTRCSRNCCDKAAAAGQDANGAELSDGRRI